MTSSTIGRICRALYRLKQAPHAWSAKFSSTIPSSVILLALMTSPTIGQICRALYRLKLVPRAWSAKFSSTILSSVIKLALMTSSTIGQICGALYRPKQAPRAWSAKFSPTIPSSVIQLALMTQHCSLDAQTMTPFLFCSVLMTWLLVNIFTSSSSSSINNLRWRIWDCFGLSWGILFSWWLLSHSSKR